MIELTGTCTYPRNDYNVLLEHDAELCRAARRLAAARRAAQGGSQTTSIFSEIGNRMYHQAISFALAGDHTIVPGFGSTRVLIYELVLWVEAAMTLTLQDGAVPLAGAFTVAAAPVSFNLMQGDDPHFILTPGQSFVVNSSAAGQVSGYARFRLE